MSNSILYGHSVFWNLKLNHRILSFSNFGCCNFSFSLNFESKNFGCCNLWSKSPDHRRHTGDTVDGLSDTNTGPGLVLAVFVLTNTFLMRKMAKQTSRAILTTPLLVEAATLAGAVEVTSRTNWGKVAQAHQVKFQIRITNRSGRQANLFCFQHGQKLILKAEFDFEEWSVNFELKICMRMELDTAEWKFQNNCMFLRIQSSEIRFPSMENLAYDRNIGVPDSGAACARQDWRSTSGPIASDRDSRWGRKPRCCFRVSWRCTVRESLKTSRTLESGTYCHRQELPKTSQSDRKFHQVSQHRADARTQQPARSPSAHAGA